jgi:hypothetical protein
MMRAREWTLYVTDASVLYRAAWYDSEVPVSHRGVVPGG